jgi:tetratricopeptide (TPR) repeat protein
MLSSLGIDPSLIRHVQPCTRRTQWQAIVNWLTRYPPPAEGPNLEQVRGYLEAFYHLCEIEEWQRALSLMLHKLDTPAQAQLHYQLKLWGYLPEQMKLYKALVDHVEPQWQGRLLQFLGAVSQSQGNYDQAQTYCDRSLEIFQTVGDPVDRGMVLSHLGEICYALGDYAAAIDYQEQWLAIAGAKG